MLVAGSVTVAYTVEWVRWVRVVTDSEALDPELLEYDNGYDTELDEAETPSEDCTRDVEAGSVEEPTEGYELLDVGIAVEPVSYPSLDVVPMIVGKVSISEYDVLLLLEVLVAGCVSVPLLVYAGPVSIQEQADDTLDGSLSHLETNLGSPVVAVFVAVVYVAQNCSPAAEAA